jgi:hypothetical protein
MSAPARRIVACPPATACDQGDAVRIEGVFRVLCSRKDHWRNACGCHTQEAGRVAASTDYTQEERSLGSHIAVHSSWVNTRPTGPRTAALADFNASREEYALRCAWLDVPAHRAASRQGPPRPRARSAPGLRHGQGPGQEGRRSAKERRSFALTVLHQRRDRDQLRTAPKDTACRHSKPGEACSGLPPADVVVCLPDRSWPACTVLTPISDGSVATTMSTSGRSSHTAERRFRAPRAFDDLRASCAM